MSVQSLRRRERERWLKNPAHLDGLTEGDLVLLPADDKWFQGATGRLVSINENFDAPFLVEIGGSETCLGMFERFFTGVLQSIAGYEEDWSDVIDEVTDNAE